MGLTITMPELLALAMLVGLLWLMAGDREEKPDPLETYDYEPKK